MPQNIVHGAILITGILVNTPMHINDNIVEDVLNDLLSPISMVSFIVVSIISRLDNECIIILNSFIHTFLPLMCRLHFKFERRTLIV